MHNSAGHAPHGHLNGREVTPERGSLGNPSLKRARRRLETDGIEDIDDTHDHHDWGAGRHDGVSGRPGENKETKAQLLSESIIELLHVCTLIQVALNDEDTANDAGMNITPHHAQSPPEPSSHCTADPIAGMQAG